MPTPPASTRRNPSTLSTSWASLRSADEPAATPLEASMTASSTLQPPETPGLPRRTTRSNSLSASRASLPSLRSVPSLPSLPSLRAMPSVGGPNVRHALNFQVGIRQAPELADGFAASAQGGHTEPLRYIVDYVNPNLVYGSVLNVGKALVNPAAAPLVLKQNCVYCSKAADENLEALATGEPTSFWIADKTSSGALPPEGSADHSVRSGDRISDLLAAEIRQGTRAIVSVPQKQAAPYSHAMNCVHAADGSLHVLDPQNRELYDLSQEADRRRFDDKFGYNGGPAVARLFTTGLAPQLSEGRDKGSWLVLT